MSYYNTGDKKAPYSFHHIQDLVSDFDQFESKVDLTELTGNVDSPESGMDALMQAIVCDGMPIWL